MMLSRRSFTAGAVSAAVAAGVGSRANALASANVEAALAAIRAFGEADLAFNRLPAMTLGVVTPDGDRTVMNFGYANMDSHAPITGDTLFQIGSITKSMLAAMLHQFAAEGRLRLTDRISDLLPQVPLTPGNAVQVQHLLDHTSGLASDPPMFPADGLWSGFTPGTHWSYSNTGYEILGKMAEQVGGKPLDQLLRERIFNPLGMNRTRGAIIGVDRQLYAQGYEAADPLATYVPGVPLAPAPWVEVSGGADCVGSTAEDMLALLTALANAAKGKGALGLSPEQALRFAFHAVPSESPGLTYGNGLMHVSARGRRYLHHTGGMLSFSSSFHVDVDSGVGAFASATISAFAGYRPRLLTFYAVNALTDALAGRPVPLPPRLEPKLANPSSYVGRYSSAAGGFEVGIGSPLTITANGVSAPLTPWDEDVFHTAHPAFREYGVMFERPRNGVATLASWGPKTYGRQGANVFLPQSDPSLGKLAGRYISDDPWFPPAVVVERGGKLWIGTETPMTGIGENLWRVGKDSWSPERASFADFIDGRPQTFVFSAVKYARHDI